MLSVEHSRPLWAAAATVAAAAVLLSACASATRPTAIVAPATASALVQKESPVYQSMGVGRIEGGSETTLISNSKVSNASFREALTTSLRLNGLLADVGAEDFTVDATIESVEQPLLQINFTTTATVFYRVLSESGAILHQERVTTTSEAKFTDSIVRSERIRIATEGAMRENIAQFLDAFVETVKANPYPYFVAS